MRRCENVCNVFPNTRKLAGRGQGVGGAAVGGFLEEHLGCTNHMQTPCQEIKACLRYIPRDNEEELALTLSRPQGDRMLHTRSQLVILGRV